MSRGARPSAGERGVTWKIHSEMVLLLGWGRAILLQLAHPLVACAIADHSLYRAQRLRRLHWTLDAMLTLTFGTTQEVERASRAINVALGSTASCARGLASSLQERIIRLKIPRCSARCMQHCWTRSCAPTNSTSASSRGGRRIATVSKQVESSRCSEFLRTTCREAWENSNSTWTRRSRAVRLR